jgi:molecular chaperone DnaJ
MRPSSGPPDSYAALGLAPGATRAEIRRAYRRLAMAVHPDVAGRDTTAEMAALNGARDDLLSRTPGRRRADEGPADAGADGGPAPRPSRPAAEPGFSHAPVWDDYWAAWNDPPRRTPP